MFAVLVEHTGGKWPFWLSPRQVSIIPVSEKDGLPEYGKEIADIMKESGYYVALDESG